MTFVSVVVQEMVFEILLEYTDLNCIYVFCF